MTVSVAGIPAEIANLIQDNTLIRVFHDALFPRLLFRSEARPETWAANLGERALFTRSGLIPVKTTPLTPGSDPAPSTYASEQWAAEARQFGDSIDTHMPTSYVTLASQYLRNTLTLGLNAGQTLNRISRNSLYQAYLSGDTVNIDTAAIAATSIHVASILGFTEVQLLGRPQPVSAANPLAISFSNTEPDNEVIAAVPDDPANPFGPGVLSLSAALTVGLTARSAAAVGVRAVTRARIFRVGGGATVDAITGADILTVQDVINAVAILRNNNVPPMEDGYYHVHLSASAEAEVFDDNQFQRLHQSLPDSAAYRDLSIGQLVGSRWYRNTEAPNAENVGDLVVTTDGAGVNARGGSEINADVINEGGIPVERTIVMGGGAMYEKFLDESKFITEAGVTGKIGEFSVVNGGVQVMTNRIRFIARSPLDRLQQVYAQTWSWSGDFPIPSDQVTGSLARFKRSIVIEHA